MQVEREMRSLLLKSSGERVSNACLLYTSFGELDKICKPECIFASNTSSLSITEIGKGVSRPLVGMHF